MKQYTKARIAAGIALTVFFAGPSYIQHIKVQHAGRDAFLSTQANLYDARFAHPSLLRDVTTAIIVSLFVIAIYEGLAFAAFIYLFNRDDSDTHI